MSRRIDDVVLYRRARGVRRMNDDVPRSFDKERYIVAAALIGSLAGWAAARTLERHSRRPRLWWSLSASTAASVSMIGPSWLAGGSSAVALMALHFVTAIVVIVGFAGTIPLHGAGRPQRKIVPRTSTS